MIAFSITARGRGLLRGVLPSLLLLVTLDIYAQSQSTTLQGLPVNVWPAGTHLADIEHGGRVVTFHRGVLYLGGAGRTYYYDIRNPQAPSLLRLAEVGENGHRWFKMGDLFAREYVNRELTGGYSFGDLSNIAQEHRNWTNTNVPLNIRSASALNAFPYLYASWSGALEDMRNNWQAVGYYTPAEWNNLKGLSSDLYMRIGNLLIYQGAGDGQGGISVMDIGDPANVRTRDVLLGNFRQYSDSTFVWRHYAIFVRGGSDNHGGNNLVAIDFSDPDNLRVEPRFSFPPSVIGSGRYVAFQDHYAFVVDGTNLVKLNMETGQRVLTMSTGGSFIQDFWPMPLGHLVVASGSEANNNDRTHIFAHQSTRDTTPPSVGYHLPRHGDTRQPVTTVVGLVIAETLDDTTLNSNSIQIRPVGGTPVLADVVSSNFNVINIAPRHLLQADTTYEVLLVQNGIRDVAGNGIGAYRFCFSTGETLDSACGGSGSSSSSSWSSSSQGQVSSASASSVDPGSIGSSSVSSSSRASSSQPVVSGPPRITGFQLPSPAMAGNTLTLAVDVEGGEHPLEYRWQFGDGQSSNWRRQHPVQHRYAEAGDYTLVVQVRDSAGRSATLTRNLILHEPGADTSGAAADRLARLRSSPIIVDGARRRVWVVNPDSNSVTRIHPDTLVRQRITPLPDCLHPMGVTLDNQGNAWIACRDSDRVQIVNANGQAGQHIDLPRGSRPVSILMSPTGDHAYAALYASGDIARIHTGNRQWSRIHLGATPWAMSLSNDGRRLWVTHLIAPDTGGEISEVDLNSFTAHPAVIPLPVDNDSPEAGVSARGLPNYVAGLALTPGHTGGAWYSAQKANILRGLLRDGQPLRHDATLRSLIGKVSVDTRQEQLSRRADIDDTSQPSAVALSPSGAHVLVTMQGSNLLVALSQHNGVEVARADTGLAPQGIAIDPHTQRIFVQNFLSRSVTVLEGASLFSDTGRSLTVVRDLDTILPSQELLEPAVLRGKQVFYNAADSRMSLEGYISCASCHLDGDHDGRVWDFTDRGEGLRSTQPLKGRVGADHGRFHWSGNFDEIQDFEHDIRVAFGGTGFLSHAQFAAGSRSEPLGDGKAGLSQPLDDLAAYVLSLVGQAPSPYRNGDSTLTAEAAAGRLVFERQQCAACHAGPAFTNSWRGKLHDVGTLDITSGNRLGDQFAGIDTPSLLGLWNRSHYLHNGSAPTLEALLTHPAGQFHGGMSALTAQERRELVAYLRQIDADEAARFPAAPSNLRVD